MLRQFLKSKRGQNTAEYALLIALVVAGVIAMQTYAQRSLQARMRDASQYLVAKTSNVSIGLGATQQYEPYYLKSNYEITRNSEENKRLGEGLVAQDSTSNRTRGDQGYQESSYDTSGTDGTSQKIVGGI